METIAKFVGVKYDSVRRLVLAKKNRFAELGLNVSLFGAGGDRKSDNFQSEFKSVTNKIKFNEEQATFLLTLMKNTPQVEEFKFNLVKEFYRMRNELQEIRIKAIEEKAQKEIEQIKALANKVKLYDDGTTSLTGMIQHYDFEYSYETIKNALIYAKVIRVEPKISIRSIPNREYQGIIWEYKHFKKDGQQSNIRDVAYYPQQVKTLVDRYVNAGYPDVTLDIEKKFRNKVEQYINENLHSDMKGE